MSESRNNPFLGKENRKAFLPIFTDYSEKTINLHKGEKFFPYFCINMIGFISKGLLKVSMSNEDGEERLMWFLEKNCILNCNSKFLQTTTALEPTEIILLDKEILFDKILANKELFYLFLDQLYQKFEYSLQQVLTENKKSSKVKLYTLIQQLAKIHGTVQPDKSIFCKTVITRRDMASITGVHRSNIIKYITELERMGIICKQKNAIIIKEPLLLDKLIELEDDCI